MVYLLEDSNPQRVLDRLANEAADAGMNTECADTVILGKDKQSGAKSLKVVLFALQQRCSVRLSRTE
jgi:hypothetical protein